MTRCPKCDRELVTGANACAGCGLAATHFDRFEQEPAQPPPELTAAWERCVARWDDEETHERFLDVVARTDGFAYAGHLYRRTARERGAEEPRVVEGLERVRRMAEAACLTRPPAESQVATPSGYRVAIGLLVLFVLLVALGALTLNIVQRMRRDDPAEGARPSRATDPARRAPGSRVPIAK